MPILDLLLGPKKNIFSTLHSFLMFLKKTLYTSLANMAKHFFLSNILCVVYHINSPGKFRELLNFWKVATLVENHDHQMLFLRKEL